MHDHSHARFKELENAATAKQASQFLQSLSYWQQLLQSTLPTLTEDNRAIIQLTLDSIQTVSDRLQQSLTDNAHDSTTKSTDSSPFG
jgi:hypothetical protein